MGIVLYVVLDALAQLLPPHYSPISQAESDLAVGKYGFLMTINFVNRGILSLAFVFAFLRTLDSLEIPRSRFRAGTSLLLVWAVGALLLALFPTDVPATPVSWHGAIHLVVALIAFIGGAFGTLAISIGLEQPKDFQEMRHVALPLSILTLVLWIAEGATFAVSHLNSQVGGLIERLFLGSVLLWIGVMSYYLATRTLHSKTLVKREAR